MTRESRIRQPRSSSVVRGRPPFRQAGSLLAVLSVSAAMYAVAEGFARGLGKDQPLIGPRIFRSSGDAAGTAAVPAHVDPTDCGAARMVDASPVSETDKFRASLFLTVLGSGLIGVAIYWLARWDERRFEVAKLRDAAHEARVSALADFAQDMPRTINATYEFQYARVRRDMARRDFVAFRATELRSLNTALGEAAPSSRSRTSIEAAAAASRAEAEADRIVDGMSLSTSDLILEAIARRIVDGLELSPAELFQSASAEYAKRRQAFIDARAGQTLCVRLSARVRRVETGCAIRSLQHWIMQQENGIADPEIPPSEGAVRIAPELLDRRCGCGNADRHRVSSRVCVDWIQKNVSAEFDYVQIALAKEHDGD